MEKVFLDSFIFKESPLTTDLSDDEDIFSKEVSYFFTRRLSVEIELVESFLEILDAARDVFLFPDNVTF